MSKIPDKVATAIRELLWSQADELRWTQLSSVQKTALYEEWSKSPKVGRVLEGYLDGRNVRVYIKDVMMKPYGRIRMQDGTRVFALAGIDSSVRSVKDYVKPHGRLLSDGRILCWGPARDWKSIVLALHGRSYGNKRTRAFAAVLFDASGKLRQRQEQSLVEDASTRLGIERLIWADTNTV